MSDGSSTKVSAIFTDYTMTALDAAAALTGDNKTDTINRAIQVYAAILRLAERGGGTADMDLFVWRNCQIKVKPGPTML